MGQGEPKNLFVTRRFQVNDGFLWGLSIVGAPYARTHTIAILCMGFVGWVAVVRTGEITSIKRWLSRETLQVKELLGKICPGR